MRETHLCLRHARHIEWQLDRLGLTVGEFEGNILDMLDDAERVSHISRALLDEARLARQKLQWAQDAIAAGKLKVLELELRFARAQFDAVSSTGSAHKTSSLADRLWQLQHRIDDLEAQISELRPSHGGLTG